METLLPKVLVVDDVKLNRVVLCRVLERLGFQPLECCTGAEAVQAFTRYGSHIACILMDINMPVMDGLEATFRIREEERRLDRSSIWRSCGSTERGQVDACTSRNNIAAVPIWAISACCEDEQWHSPVLAYLGDDERRGPLWKRAGIDAFLSKPVNVSELLERLKALNKSRSQLDTRQQSLPLKKAEFWEEKGLKRRCSFEGAAPLFPNNAGKARLQGNSMLLTSKIAE